MTDSNALSSQQELTVRLNVPSSVSRGMGGDLR